MTRKTRRRMYGLQRDLDELERTDPEVAQARAALDRLYESFGRRDRHMAARKAIGVRSPDRSNS